MKSKILHAFLSCIFIIFSGNTFAQGGVLPLNSTVTGNISSATPVVYTVTTPLDGLLRLRFTTVSPADLFITLFDNDGTTAIATAESFNNSTVFVNADGLASGTYTIKITPFSTAYGSYTVTDSLFTSGITNDIEPNGTAASALALPQNGSRTGHVGYYYNNLRDTADWYKVTTNADGLLRVYLAIDKGSIYSTTSTNPLDVDLALYQSDGTTLLGSVEVFNGYAPATNFITQDGLAPGTYYIKVQPFSSNQFANYKVYDSLFTTPVANDAEPNGSRATAIILSENGSKTGHVGYVSNNQRDTADWYKITTTTDGLLKVYLTTIAASKYSTTTTNPLDVDLTLYDNDGITQLGGVEVFNGNGPATNFIIKDGLAPGTYYIKIQNFSTTEFSNYKVFDTLFTATLANDAEPNDNRATAVILPQNGSKTGHVGYYYNNGRDTTDWYKLTTTSDGLLRVYLTTANAGANSTASTDPLDVNLTLYDNDGITQLGAVEVFNGYGPATNLITKDGLAPGTYYIKVQNFSTAEFANYKVSDTLFTATLPNDAEPNGNRATAFSLPLNKSLTGHVGYYYNNQRDTTDWYKVTTTSDGLLRIYLSTDSGSIHSNTSTNLLDVDLTLYDNDGATQLGAVEVFNGYAGATNIITKDGLQAGTYYIKVQNFSTTEFSNYKITDSLFVSTSKSDPEPNGTIATAVPFALNKNVSGHVGYYYNNQSDTADFYKLVTTVTAPVSLYLSSKRGTVYSTNPLDMLLIVYNSDGITERARVEIFKGNNPATDSLIFASLPAGKYFIKVINFSTSGFADYSLINTTIGAGVLPVTFLNFGGTLDGSTAKLTWSTANEFNNLGFEVQKSTDGLNFSNLAFIQGNGNSSVVNNYYYNDSKVVSGNNYYRLKQIDNNNNSEYSSTIQLDFERFDWAIFGNPVSSKSWIQLQLAKTTKVALQIISIDGKIIKTIDKGIMEKGTYSIPLSPGNLVPGLYVVKLLTDGQSFIKTIIK